jgi:hypothetical protein
METGVHKLFGCCFYLKGHEEEVDGLFSGHTYSILRAVESRSGKRFLVIRNPWGEGEWTGPWSDGAKEWTDEKNTIELLNEIGHEFGNDGQFVMECKSFLFRSI